MYKKIIAFLSIPSFNGFREKSLKLCISSLSLETRDSYGWMIFVLIEIFYMIPYPMPSPVRVMHIFLFTNIINIVTVLDVGIVAGYSIALQHSLQESLNKIATDHPLTISESCHGTSNCCISSPALHAILASV